MLFLKSLKWAQKKSKKKVIKLSEVLFFSDFALFTKIFPYNLFFGTLFEFEVHLKKSLNQHKILLILIPHTKICMRKKFGHIRTFFNAYAQKKEHFRIFCNKQKVIFYKYLSVSG
jgi:hypothetical protein